MFFIHIGTVIAGGVDQFSPDLSAVLCYKHHVLI
jgi:hypothetical protein